MTHNERVLELLSDGKPHTHHEIYGLYVIGHSRIADLRKRGHVIESWRDGDDYLYQLVQDCSDGTNPPRVTADDKDAAVPPSAPSEQLSLEGTLQQIGKSLEHIDAQLDEMLAV